METNKASADYYGCDWRIIRHFLWLMSNIAPSRSGSKESLRVDYGAAEQKPRSGPWGCPRRSSASIPSLDRAPVSLLLYQQVPGGPMEDGQWIHDCIEVAS